MTHWMKWAKEAMPTKQNGAPDPTAKSVLMALTLYAGGKGTCFPSQPTLCTATGFGETAVRLALKTLEEQRFISRMHSTYPSGPRMGQRRNDTYYLDYERQVADDEVEDDTQGEDDAEVEERPRDLQEHMHPLRRWRERAMAEALMSTT